MLKKIKIEIGQKQTATPDKMLTRLLTFPDGQARIVTAPIATWQSFGWLRRRGYTQEAILRIPFTLSQQCPVEGLSFEENLRVKFPACLAALTTLERFGGEPANLMSWAK